MKKKKKKRRNRRDEKKIAWSEGSLENQKIYGIRDGRSHLACLSRLTGKRRERRNILCTIPSLTPIFVVGRL